MKADEREVSKEKENAREALRRLLFYFADIAEGTSCIKTQCFGCAMNYKYMNERFCILSVIVEQKYRSGREM